MTVNRGDKMDLISVIVPVYNVEKYLRKCVDSICAQTYKNLEIILVDDGSLDQSGEICEEFKKNDNRIKVIHKKNGGLGLTRNSGMERMTGQYVTFIDSDDWIGPDHIENLYQAIKKAQADVCMGEYTRVFAIGQPKQCHGKLEKKLYTDDEVIEKIVLPIIGPDTTYRSDSQVEASCWRNLYRVDVIKQNDIKFISERYAVSEDTFFNIDYLMHAHKVIAISETGYYYLENNESISQKYNPKRFARTVSFYKEVSNRIEKYNLKERVRYRLDRNYLTKTRVAIRHIVVSDLPYKEKHDEIRSIAKHPLTKEVVGRYPVNTLKLAIRLFVKLLAREQIVGVYWIVWFREKAQKNLWMKKVLRKIFGIKR